MNHIDPLQKLLTHTATMKAELLDLLQRFATLEAALQAELHRRAEERTKAA